MTCLSVAVDYLVARVYPLVKDLADFVDGVVLEQNMVAVVLIFRHPDDVVVSINPLHVATLRTGTAVMTITSQL